MPETKPETTSTRIWLVTGDPGSGKSTAVSRTIFLIKSQGYTVGGVLTREVRSHGEREGFRLIDVSSEESALMSTVKKIPGPSVGRYRVDLKTLSSLGVRALEHAKASSDVVVCDEVGPMELLSPEFRRAIHNAILDSKKPCLCVVHKRLVDPLIEELKSSREARLLEVTFENRGTAPDTIAKEILLLLKEAGVSS